MRVREEVGEYLEESHEKEKLQNREQWQVDVNLHLERLLRSFYVLATN